MADLKISQLPELAGSVLQADDVLAVVDLSASETKKIKAKELIQATLAEIDDDSIPGEKVQANVQPNSVNGSVLIDHTVGADQLADNSTAVLGSSLPATGDFVGQLGITTPGNEVSVWDGAAWQPIDVGIESIVGGTVDDIDTVVTTSGSGVSVLAQVKDSTVKAQFLAGPTASGGSVKLRGIVPADLPTAGLTTAGIVTVPSGGGLKIDGGVSGLESNVVIDNDIISSSAAHLVTYTDKGLVTGGREISSADLPIATTSQLVLSPLMLTSSALVLVFVETGKSNQWRHHAVVTYNSQGLITSGRDLGEDDIPDIPAKDY